MYICELLSQNECKVASMYIEIYSLLNIPQNNNKKKKKKEPKILIFVGQDNELYTRKSYIIFKLVLRRCWICGNFKKQLVLLNAHFVIAAHSWLLTLVL